MQDATVLSSAEHARSDAGACRLVKKAVQQDRSKRRSEA